MDDQLLLFESKSIDRRRGVLIFQGILDRSRLEKIHLHRKCARTRLIETKKRRGKA